MTADVLKIYDKIKLFELGRLDVGRLPSDAYYLDEELTLICNPTNSGARFPYAINGMTIWAYASGYISINHSSYYILPPNLEGKEPFIDFFGIEHNDQKYQPISLLGVSQTDSETDNTRYTVYGKNIVYYLTKTKNFLYSIIVFINQDQKVFFSSFVHNLTEKTKEITMSSFFNMLFKYDSNESVETKWFKKVTYENDMFIYDSPEDLDRHTRIENYGVIKRIYSKKPTNISSTTSRKDFVGFRYGSLRNASSIRTLRFEKKPSVTNFTDTAINGDLVTYEINPLESVITTYQIETTHDLKTLEKLKNDVLTKEVLEHNYKKLTSSMSYTLENFQMTFEDSNYPLIDTKLLNQFLKLVNYQIHFSSLSSNSGTVFLGVRDVMQQLESSLIWDRINVRKKIIEVLSFIDPSGLPPRQYSMPPKVGNPRMDLRPFIDQGLWIISTLHTYLAYTEDYDILHENCGYYERIEPNSAKKSKLNDTVLEHLIKITEYLISNIDQETRCLKALYGDWNDALDGLGLIEGSSGYGNGVTVMGTLQLFENLERMIEILINQKDYASLVTRYQQIKNDIQKGIHEFAIIKKDSEQRILHGWGNNRSYLVGSFNDPDHTNRYSLTSSAFYVISNMIKMNLSIKEDIICSFKKLDSKYGLKTFDPAFKDFHGFGRIINLPPGTAENGATYVHATLFGTLALYKLGQSRFANEQIVKILPLTHQEISTSPFIMSNSYAYNPLENMDGESMSDWYTGSANTLLKTLVRGLFGVEVDLDQLIIKPSKEFISKKANFMFYIGNMQVEIKYQHMQNEIRKFKFNDSIVNPEIDEVSQLMQIRINKKHLKAFNVIEIID